MKPSLFLSVFTGSALVASAQTPTAKSPPKGIEIPGPDREFLQSAAAKLQSELAGVASGRLTPQLRARLPDVEVFPTAVLRALAS